MPAAYITSAEFLALAGGADRVQGIVASDNLESLLVTVLEGAEAELSAGIERAGYGRRVDLEAIEDEDERAMLRSFLGQFVAGFAAQRMNGPEHLLPLAKKAEDWLKGLLNRTNTIPGIDRPEANVTRRPRLFKVTTGEKKIPMALFDGMNRIGGSR